jgi:hypothetical protein
MVKREKAIPIWKHLHFKTGLATLFKKQTRNISLIRHFYDNTCLKHFSPALFTRQSPQKLE